MKNLLSLVFVAFVYLNTFSQQHHVQQLIDNAIAHNQTLLSLPRDTYYFDAENPLLHDTIGLLNIGNASGLTIDGNGSTFIFQKIDMGIYIHHCKDLTIKNISIDYNPLPFTQGTISSLNNHQITLKIDQGYREDVEYFNIPGYDRVLLGRGRVNEICRVFPKNIKSIGNGEFKMEVADAACLQVNDPVVLLGRYENAVFSTFCENTRYENINIYSSPGFSIWELYGGGGSTLKNVRIVEGPTPTDALKRRLISSSGDALHFTSLKKGPHIESCEVRNTDDDFINLEGFMFRAFSVANHNEINVLAASYSTDFFPGDTLDIYEGESFVLKGRTIIISKRLDKFTNECILTVQTDDLVKENNFILSRSRFSRGAVIRNNKFFNAFGSINLQTEDVIFENNEINGTCYGGINIGAAYLSYGAEPTTVVVANASRAASFARNIIIRDNSLKNIRTSFHCQTSNYGPAAFWIGQDGYPQSQFDKERNNQNIRIENNTLDSCAYGAFFISNASQVSIIGNKVKNTNLKSAKDMESYWNAPDRTMFIIKNSDHISFSKNSFKISDHCDEEIYIDTLSDKSSIQNIFRK